MALLAIDGVTVPVFDGSANRSISRRGDRARSMRGVMRDGGRGSRRAWSLRACFTDFVSGYAEAEAFERHVNGEGHLATFEHGLACSTGLNPLPGYSLGAAGAWASNPGADGTVGLLSITAGGFIQYDPQVRDDEWTICFHEDPGTTVAAVYRSDGVGWLDGVVQAWSAGSYFTDTYPLVVDGIATLIAVSGADVDDLRLLPYECSTAQGVAWSTLPTGSPIVGPTPSLKMTGALIAETHTYVLGEVTGVEYAQKPQQLVGQFLSTWINNAKIVSFNLVEVPSPFVRGDRL